MSDRASQINEAHFDGVWNSSVRLKSRFQFNAAFTRELNFYGLRKALPFRENLSVLDIGFGMGTHFYFFPTSCSLTGTELSDKAIALVREDAARRGYRNVDLRRAGSPTKLDFPDDAFDAAICSHVIEHLEDDLAMLREVGRTLRPNGVACIQIPLDRFDGTVPSEEDLINPAFPLGESVHVRRYGVESFRDRLDRAGLKIVYERVGGRPMDVLMWIEDHIRSPLRRIFPPLDAAVSAALNVPLALLPFWAKRGLDRLLAAFGAKPRYGLWIVTKR